jgi:hypothetical protein
VQVKEFDIHGVLLSTLPGALKLGTTNDVQTFPIHINGYSSPLVYRADVSTQVLAGGVWTNVATQSAYLSSSNQSPDSVTIPEIGVDLGGPGGLVNGAPVAPATLTWDLGGNTTTARFAGNLYMLNSLGLKAHVRVKSLDVHGAVLSNIAGLTKEALSNNLQNFPISIASGANPLIYEVQVSIEVLVGATWTPVGTMVTAYI